MLALPRNSKAGDAIAISGFETQEKLERQGSGPLLCPGAHPGRRRTLQIPARYRRFAVRFFAVFFIGFFFAGFFFAFTAALAIGLPSLFSLVRISSNSCTMNKFV